MSSVKFAKVIKSNNNKKTFIQKELRPETETKQNAFKMGSVNT